MNKRIILNIFPHFISQNANTKQNYRSWYTHSLVLEVEMDHFQYCTDNFLGIESVAPSATPKPVE